MSSIGPTSNNSINTELSELNVAVQNDKFSEIEQKVNALTSKLQTTKNITDENVALSKKIISIIDTKNKSRNPLAKLFYNLFPNLNKTLQAKKILEQQVSEPTLHPKREEKGQKSESQPPEKLFYNLFPNLNKTLQAKKILQQQVSTPTPPPKQEEKGQTSKKQNSGFFGRIFSKNPDKNTTENNETSDASRIDKSVRQNAAQKAVQREEELEKLQDKSDSLEKGAEDFSTGAKKILEKAKEGNKNWWKFWK